ncbi:MAG: metal ABC transporter substrate-binding protein [Nitrospirota bacterium]
MKSILKVFLHLFIIVLSYSYQTYPVSADSKIKIVVTIPVLKDFVEVIGRDKVDVKSLITGLESEHTYTPKPSDIIAVKKAKLLFEVGIGLEIWVRSLIENSGNKDLIIITTSDGIQPIRDHIEESPPSHLFSKRSHSIGNSNPHVWLDPENTKIMIKHIVSGIIRVDPYNKDYYLSNQAEYLSKIDKMTQDIERKVKGLINKKIITYHPAWPYFARRFGFVISDEIVIQIGSEPSSKKIINLIRKIKDEGIRVIVSEPQLSQNIPEMIAAETGAKVVILTPLPGAISGTDDYISMMEYNADQLVRGLQ